MSRKGIIILLSTLVVIFAGLGTIFYINNKNNNEIVYYTVTFEYTGNDGQIYSSIKKVENGKTVTNIEIPELENKIFVGWYLNGEKFNLDTPIVKDITLIGRFNEKDVTKTYYKVTFNTDGGSIIETQEVEENSEANKPETPTKSGYTFIEWQLDGKTYDFSSKVTKDITLVATYSAKKTYTVSFNSNGGSAVSSQTVEENGVSKKPNNPNRSGYKFTGWTLNGSTYNFSSKVTSNITLVANWSKINYYTVTFDSNGGSAVSSQTVEENSAVTKPGDPYRSGYKFTGWTLGGSAYNFGSKVTSNITLKANWSEINYYTVTFDSNGGSAVSSQTVEENTAVTKPGDPYRSGYNFAGWTLGGSAYNFGSAVTSNITLVASWIQKSYSVKVSKVDDYSPARILTAYEEGNQISVKSFKYTDGTFLCSGTNANVNVYAINTENSLILVLNDDIEVTATVTN